MDPFLDHFRLSGEDTILDYQNSSIKDSVKWISQMCDDGKCLDHRDWMCGFEIEEWDAVTVCVIETAEQIEESTSLDALRKYCGKKHSVFSGRFGSTERCTKARGVWGVLKPVYLG